MIVRMGRFCFRNRWWVVGAWLVILFGVQFLQVAVGTSFTDQLEVPDSETKDGFDALDEYFGGVGNGLTGQVVFSAEQGVDDPAVQEAMEDYLAEFADRDGVTILSPYEPEGAGQVATDGDLAGQVAFATVEMNRDEVDETEAGALGEDLREAKPELDGLVVFTGGAALEGFEPPESELIGVGFAVIILIVAFGSVLAMGLPIGVAAVGVATGLALSGLLSNVQSMPGFATTIGAMIGLGVGIDYALFIVTRYRELLHEGRTGEEAIALAMDTAGRAVVFAGITVVVSLMGLLIIGLQFVAGLGIAAAVTVLATMATTVTLLPALVALAGDRIERTRWRGLVAAGLAALAFAGIGLDIEWAPFLLLAALLVVAVGSIPALPLHGELPARKAKPLRDTIWYRFSRVVQHRPWTVAIAGTAVLLLITLPVLDIRLAFSDEGNFEETTDARQAYDLLSEAFGPGFNGPFVVTVELGADDGPARFEALTAGFESQPGVAAVQGPLPDDFEDPEAAVYRVIPTTAPESAETSDLVDTLRADVIAPAVEGTGTEVNITGFAAAGTDFSRYLAERTAWFFAAVLVLSFILLMVVFRSLLVPLKAVVMNMLSISAAYGVMVAVFQWGWLADVVGIGKGAPIEPFIPMMMFAVVFGLSMDYEVFLLSRIKEEYERTGDAVNSVADGLAATARVITAAAAIMVVVFGSFMLEDNRVIKLFGLGLAVAILLDATLVRMLLVPATMELLGDRNWWIPKWLDRVLPELHIEGHADLHADPSAQGPDDAPEPDEPDRVPELV